MHIFGSIHGWILPRSIFRGAVSSVLPLSFLLSIHDQAAVGYRFFGKNPSGGRTRLQKGETIAIAVNHQWEFRISRGPAGDDRDLS